MGSRIVVVGSFNYDLVAYVDRRPEPGDSVRARELRLDPGGKGFNQAAALRKLGAEVEMLGALGDDWFGDEFRRRLSDLGIAHGRVLTVGERTGIAMPVVDASGQNAIVVALGANHQLFPEQVPPDLFAGAAAVLLQGELRPDTTSRAAELAAAAGAVVVLNAAPAETGLVPAFAHSDVLVVNQAEARQLGGVEALLQSGARQVALTLGAAGVRLIGEEEAQLPAPEVEVIDTTGAGDAFAAALGYCLAGGRSLIDAARWAVAAGAVVCTRGGTSSAMPAPEEVEALLRRL